MFYLLRMQTCQSLNPLLNVFNGWFLLCPTCPECLQPVCSTCCSPVAVAAEPDQSLSDDSSRLKGF